ncbi:MAG: DEAD/DEAH box helicase [Candidatus Altiarchaeota archaeon]|nr:DEAD/DEAH box helicase [Candidatus Altiarchaeota archaeon]
MRISELKIPEKAKRIFEGEGIKELYPPQQAAVEAGLIEGKSLVLCTPTASGKTMAAELATLKALEKGGQVIYVVPLRALASEKYEEFLKWQKLGYRVDLQMGDLDSKFLPKKGSFDVLIATAEKCDSILRSRPDWFGNVRLLVMDEIHLITTDRGPTYEILIAKFKKLFPNVQILGLSATIGNAEELAEWLGATLVRSDWRPVELTQKVELGKAKTMTDETKKAIDEGAQALIFVNSRNSAEAVAEKLGETFLESYNTEMKEKLEELSKEICEVLSPPTAQCKRLSRSVKGGAAFHHAGLTNAQRKIVENAFKDGRIKVISATPTLAAGINLPARKVIIRDIKRYSGLGLDYIPVLEYFQMCGRAGRPKYDSYGESVLLAQNEYEKEFLEETYLRGQPEDIHSQLGIEPILRMHVLASIASGFTRDKKTLLDFFSSTFFAYEYGIDDEFARKIEKILMQLEDWRFIRGKGEENRGDFISASSLTEDNPRLVPTPLGSRVSELYLDPEDAHNFIVTMETPENVEKMNTFGLLELLCNSYEMRPLLNIKRSEEDDIWGLYYEYEDKLLSDTTASDYLNRFKTALMLNDWLGERSEEFILENYGLAPGLLRIKLDVAEWLAYSYSEIAPHLKLGDVSPITREFQRLQIRLRHGVKEELVPLVTIRNVGRVRARKLFDAGLKTRDALKKAETKMIGELVGVGVAKKIKAEL